MTHPRHQDPEPTLDVAHGDRVIARHLTESLRLLRARSEDEGFRRLVDDVLAGRRSLREVYATPEFAAGINPGVEEFARRYEKLDRDERERLAEEGQRQLQAERDNLNNRP